MAPRGLMSMFLTAIVFAIGWLVGRNLGGRVGLV